jgi:hypothetical protein
LAKRIEKEQVGRLKKALCDQRALFASMIKQESAIAYTALLQTRKEIDEFVSKHEHTVESWNKQARLQFEDLQNDVSRVKRMIQEFSRNYKAEVTTIVRHLIFVTP